MKRFVLFLATLAAISQGCTYDPHNGESVNGSSYAPNGYSFTSGGVVVHYLVNAENGSKSDFADIYESGNGWGVYASSSPTSWYGYTGYKWQWPNVNIATTYPDVVGCINPGVTDDAHSYFKTVFGGSILGGTSGSAGGYVMNSDPASCWGTYAAGQSTNDERCREGRVALSRCLQMSPQGFAIDAEQPSDVILASTFGQQATSVGKLLRP